MTAIVDGAASPLEDPRFVLSAIWPLVATPAEQHLGSSPVVTVRRRRADGRLVVELAFGPSSRVFAKHYPGVAAGAAAYDIHRRLWEDGFGAGAAWCVPEPLAYLPDHRVLLLRAAVGEQLASLPPPLSLDAFRAAACWLAALHASNVDLDASEDAAQGLLRLSRRVPTAAAVRPELEEVFRGLLDVLAERYARVVAHAERALTHGRFSAEHVYVTHDSVTAVDLDRAALADPAKDVGELLHRLRWNTGKRAGVPEGVDAAGVAFVREYLRSSRFALSALEYHWSLSVVWTLLVLASKDRPGKGWNERSGFLLAELDAIPRRCRALLGG